MTVALCALSHSPLYGIAEPAAGVLAEVDAGLRHLQAFARAFDPEVTVVFGPDHFNGVFYDMMPAFCIGRAATAVGDWGTREGPLAVDRAAASRLTQAVLDSGIDIAQSERLVIDHGIAQPMEFLFGKGFMQPLVPVFINAVGLPLGPMQRVRLLGEAVGREVARWNRRVLLVASGGLSHDPPVPRLADATADVAARLIDGRNPTPEARALRQQRVIEAGRTHAQGHGHYQEVNPAFDRKVLDLLSTGALEAFDVWRNEQIETEGGHSGHEIRAWVAAFAALHAIGPYRMTHRGYWPVREWMTGFALACAELEQHP
ncbi:3-carboxyethylcatechol 2,3-dioxygenase [Pseudacidovorax sp. NFM-22]|uniref:3-carboxyethylcatechol 2,3-dioxygenase n=1 Tax=Pseudacidovorax sp. NFM-22 TaxID=2744469 RepID=UPI001F2B53EE|nr:3-carboxyethylcatechol 2,3-dioxygenase [Pseudacidovorax sp. NFM-22]